MLWKVSPRPRQSQLVVKLPRLHQRLHNLLPLQPNRSRSDPSQRSPPLAPQGGVDPYESSLTLENLVGELKLDPLFPDSAEAETLSPVTAENLFGQDSESPGDAAPAAADQTWGTQSVTPFPVSPEPGQPPAPPARQGIDVFAEEDLPAAAAGYSPQEGIDLFGTTSPAEPAPPSPGTRGD